MRNHFELLALDRFNFSPHPKLMTMGNDLVNKRPPLLRIKGEWHTFAKSCI